MKCPARACVTTRSYTCASGRPHEPTSAQQADVGHAILCNLRSEPKGHTHRHGMQKGVRCGGIRALGDLHRAAIEMMGSLVSARKRSAVCSTICTASQSSLGGPQGSSVPGMRQV